MSERTDTERLEFIALTRSDLCMIMRKEWNRGWEWEVNNGVCGPCVSRPDIREAIDAAMDAEEAK